MDGSADQQQPLLNSPVAITDVIITEETPLTDQQPDQTDGLLSAIPETLEWSTSLLSQICREGDIARLRLFTEYSQQTMSCGKHAAEIADRLDIETGLSPLHHAARYQQLHICLMLLSNIEFELGVNIKDEHGRTPIHSAFRASNSSNSNKSESEKLFDIDLDFGNKIQDLEAWQDEYTTKILTNDHPLIYLFAKAHGDLTAHDKYNLTPLHHAVARNNLHGVKQLITFNVNIESQDRQEMRPLHYACKEGYLSIVEYLLEKGGRIDAVDGDNMTPLHYACAKGHLEIMELIKLKAENDFQKLIQIKTNTKASCLHLAVQNGSIVCVEYILNEFRGETLRILLNEQAEPFGTPLHIAAKFSDSSLINLLYRHGADPLIPNAQDQSALHIACAFNRLSIVKELLSLTQASLLELKDRRGQTALSVTTNTDIIDELLTFGADISSLDNKNMNVLMVAVSKNRISIVEHLLFAINDKLPDVFNQVTKNKKRSIFLLAVYTGSIRMCSALLASPHIQWDAVDKNRLNLFHIAARDDHYELIEFLCNHIRKCGRIFSIKSISHSSPSTDFESTNIPQSSPILRVYIDAQNEDGKSPLHLAAEEGHRLCIEALLKHGADVLLPNFLGQLPLHMAIQHGHSRCVEILLQVLMRNMADFQLVLARRQSPLITACQNGFIEIVRLLLAQEIGLDDKSDGKDDNPLEIAIKYRQIQVVNELLEHPRVDEWLTSVKKGKGYHHQTPLRDMIQYTPQSAKHAFDKFIIKTIEIDQNNNAFEITTYNYKYIDDYFTGENRLYDNNHHHLYRNHPFIIALDTDHHSLLEHPLAQQLLKRKWEQYRWIFYFYLILRLILVLIVSFYVLIVPPPQIDSTTKKLIRPTNSFLLAIRWTIVILGGINFLRLIFEIIRYRGFRVPFAQILGIVSFLTAIIGFIPLQTKTEMSSWQWELAACSTLCQWFNTAFKSRSVPFIGNCIILFQSILFNFLSLAVVTLPLLIAFTIATHMIFYNHRSFLTNSMSLHKLTAMIVGEFEFETLFYSKPTLETAAVMIFVSFLMIMTIIFMNLLLGLTVGDIQSCMENARLKAKSYRIREVIYIESTLPNLSRLRSNIIDSEIIDVRLQNSPTIQTDEDDSLDALADHQHSSEPSKLLDILNMLCRQAKHVLAKEVHLERLLRQLLSTRRSDRLRRD